MSCTFYLGTHKPHWLARTDAPLFISRRRLAEMKKLPRALGRWALDSGGFTELNLYGTWKTTAWEYIDEVRRYRDEVGGLDFAAVQDWMCEPFMLKKTGLTVERHQRLTTWSFVTLKSLAPEIPWMPVLQGWTRDDYLRHVEEYHRALPFPLSGFRRVGLGSVCRRQGTQEAEEIVRELSGMGLKLHAFGFKLNGLKRTHGLLASADSMSWSYAARREPPLHGHPHKSCANCLEYATKWREKVMRHLAKHFQRSLF